ncbi:hypothetical protein R2217_000749 [Cronobacter turicensis]|nr:hypothetical protein [Cronobacter turicensis]ELQ6074639.1 hypothetical protein [Cronobacter turicensis]ELQ6183775.1 hypothetical protein [Cronobacter turicensis]ELQ6234721.1 hypothetical protein [Cronobacter turicensis]ELQ6238601.1 hypothetical protein [Cronobacter turicensis]
MPVPNHILEEYVFDVSGLGTVKGRIVKPIFPNTSVIYWQISHIGSTHVQNFSENIDTVRELLFHYADTLDSSAKPNTAY